MVNLTKILESAQHLEEVSSRVEDKIVSKGEKLSCMYMAALLQDRGVPAQFVDLSDIIKCNGSPLKGLDESFYKNLAQSFAEEVRACGDKVPVITGYFGSVPGGILSSIGRGYTDLCAALVAVGIQAQELRKSQLNASYSSLLTVTMQKSGRKWTVSSPLIPEKFPPPDYYLALPPPRRPS